MSKSPKRPHQERRYGYKSKGGQHVATPVKKTKQRQESPSAYEVSRSVISIDKRGLPSDHPLVDVNDRFHNRGFLRSIVLLTKAKARQVPKEILDNQAEHALNLHEAMQKLPAKLEGLLGRVSVFGNVDNPASAKYVNYHFDDALAAILRVELGTLYAVEGLHASEPAAPILCVWCTHDGIAAEALKKQLNRQQPVGIVLGKPFTSAFQL